MDVVTAFLNGEVKNLIYMERPKGLDVSGMVYRLKNALYELKQSPRLWYKEASDFLLTKLGLTSLYANH